MQGKVFCTKTRQIKGKLTLLSFYIVDFTEAVQCKIFLGSRNDKQIIEEIKDGMYIKTRGKLCLDRYEKNIPIVEPKDIEKIEIKERIDECEKKRVELHCHTKMSSLDAVMAPTELVCTAALWGHKAVAITDHGVVQAFPEAAVAGKKFGIKVIYGMEGYLIDDSKPVDEKGNNFHIIILAKNYIGLRNLYKLVSISHIKHYKKRPRIIREDIIKYREGLMLGSACEAGELFRAVIAGKKDDELRKIGEFYDYFEIQPISNNEFMVKNGHVSDCDKLKEFNKKIIFLGDTMNKVVLATTDAHFLNKEDEIYRSIILSAKNMENFADSNPLYYRNTEQMLKEFEYLGKDKAKEIVITNTNLIAGQIDSLQPIPSELYIPKINGAQEEILRIAHKTAMEIYGEKLPYIVSERLEYELQAIINHGYAVLYYIAYKLVKKSNLDGYLVGSRGSIGSSFVATITGITEVNPLPPHWVCPFCKKSEFIVDGSFTNGFDLPDKKCCCGNLMKKDGHDIPFAVFMGFKKNKVPDIDLNFSGEYQSQIHKYTEKLLGKENVFRAGTISTVADKSAEAFTRAYFKKRRIFASEAYIKSCSEKCIGVKRTTGQHPGGLMVIPHGVDIHEITPIQYSAEAIDRDITTTHFDYHSIHNALVKLDNLGHDAPTIIKHLQELSGFDVSNIPFNDPYTLSLFNSTKAINLTSEQLQGCSVATLGIPEFGTSFVRQILEVIRPKQFSDLVRIAGFSHGTDVWFSNAKDLIDNKIGKINEIVSSRDDIMNFLMKKGLDREHAFNIMEQVRKGQGLKKEDIKVMKAIKVKDWYVNSCNKIKYLFPKAHAVAYVIMAFRIAYFKVHYPLAFYAASFSVKTGDFDAEKICNGLNRLQQEYEMILQKGTEASQKEKACMPLMELAMEAYLRKIEFTKINLNESHSFKFKIKGDRLLPPLAALNGVGENAASNIIAARKERPFTSIRDLQSRAHLNKVVIEVFDVNGILDGLDTTDQISLF